MHQEREFIVEKRVNLLEGFVDIVLRHVRQLNVITGLRGLLGIIRKAKKIRRAKRQYKTMSGKGVKNKLSKLSISEFIQLPYYDLVRLSAIICTGNKPTKYNLSD